ncbi:C4-dicarboxylate ABC transporter [Streptomyces sp. PKU-MA01144]|uniref:SLAC1 family transporter n=1 Tax=Streptomyces sp. PKU-MA01144 TaxID=2729138 RepID=UPI0014804722|nr:C4-dicarboxylate ABC transporter [Streptomyces sp. PKU-MA01144]NNJ06686.1 C4-dicarboxylate ABC transporter [Streptomyces sp. PKU-MA01144]
MVTAAHPRSASRSASRCAPSGPLRRVTPVPRLRRLGPNWYSAVMGTASVAIAGASLPASTIAVAPAAPAAPVTAASVTAASVTAAPVTAAPVTAVSPVALPAPAGLQDVLEAVWVLSALALAALLAARAAHWVRHRDQARADLLDPAVAPFQGCMAMALLAVGIGSLTVGGGVIGEHAAVVTAWVLFAAGTTAGLTAALAVPYLLLTRRRVTAGDASPVWLLPVVAPMVAATLGAMLVGRVPAGGWRRTALLGCYGLFVLSLVAVLAVLPLVTARLLREGPPPLALTPALFLVLGPLGQSTTAVHRLADAAPSAVGGADAAALGSFATAYGTAALGLALLWLVPAAALVVRAARRGMPFAMTWWAFTFPVGTCVTGAAALSARTGTAAPGWAAAGLYAFLVAAWAVAGALTLRGLAGGALPAAPSEPPPATGRTR